MFDLSLEKTLTRGGEAWHRFKPELIIPSSLLSWTSLTGLVDYMKRYGEGIRRVLASFGPVPEFSGESTKSIVKVSLELRAQPELQWSCISTITI